MADLLHKWELPLRAYFQLRFQEVTDRLGPLLTTPEMLMDVLEAEAARNPAPPASAQPGPPDAPLPPPPTPPAPLRPPLPPSCADGVGLALEASEAVWDSLSELWRGVLPALVQRALQLTLLVCHRYRLWVSGWAGYLGGRLAAAERDGEGRRGDEELRLLGRLAGDCRAVAGRVGGEVGPWGRAALVSLLGGEDEAAAAVSVLESAAARAAGACKEGRLRMIGWGELVGMGWRLRRTGTARARLTLPRRCSRT
jgi:hypothetical protein